jgi:hypothetical protein
MKQKKGKKSEQIRRSPSLAGEEKQPISSRHTHQGEVRKGSTRYKTYDNASSHPSYKVSMDRAGDNQTENGSPTGSPDYAGGTCSA